MIRTVVGLAVLSAGLAAVGWALLRACGLVASGWSSVLRALGPAYVAGVSLLVPVLIALLVAGVPFTLVTALLAGAVLAAGCLLLARRAHGPRLRDPTAAVGVANPGPTRLERALCWAAAAGAGGYVAFGVVSLARQASRGDDPRIWSIKGLALTDYSSLRPEIFDSPANVLSHEIYPLLQPVWEALLFRAAGHPELRFYHAELWLLAAAMVWTAAWLIERQDTSAPLSRRRLARLVWLPPLALLAVAPMMATNVAWGDADITGALLLGLGMLATGLWIQSDRPGYLAAGAVFLAAAANTKDEEMIGAGLVLLAAAAVLLVRPARGRQARRRLFVWLAAAAYTLAMILPWRIWVADRHLTDSVTPPLPAALNPVYVLDRLGRLHDSAATLIDQSQHSFGWIAPVFLAVCVICLATGTARRLASFYLAVFWANIAAILWLYTTTPLSLAFLLPSSMDRTVSAFCVPAAIGAAHLLARLVPASEVTVPMRPPTTARAPDRSPPPRRTPIHDVTR